MPRTHLGPVINLDASDGDWTKRSWDLPATNVTELRAWIEGAGLTVEQFKQLAVYRQTSTGSTGSATCRRP